MKKIDFHIHTATTIKDEVFNFDLNILKKYIAEKELDIIAITNHNYFDQSQFDIIKENVNIEVFPGMEIDIENAHLLIIGDHNKTSELSNASETLNSKITDENSFITFEELESILPNYKDYILIPHYMKKPRMQETKIRKFGGLIKCGEVPNSKKFLKVIKDNSKLIPVVFSDFRPDERNTFPNRYTYIDTNEIGFDTIKCTIEDRNKVFVSKRKAASEIEYLSDGSTISSKLNVIMGTRTSGKTYNIEKIKDAFDNENCLYVPQFSLIGDAEKKKFETLIKNECSEKSDEFYNRFKPLVKKILSFNIRDIDVLVEEQLDSLKEYAKNFDIDEFSKTKIFSEVNCYIDEKQEANDLIKALKDIYINNWNKDIVDKYIERAKIKELLYLLIEEIKKDKKIIELQKETNKLVCKVKNLLDKESSANAPDSIDLVAYFKYRKLIEKVNDIFSQIKNVNEIDTQSLPLFDVSLKSKGFENATELRDKLKLKMPFKDSFDNYYNKDDLYGFVWDLNDKGLSIDQISYSILNIKYEVKNELGEEPSGGEKAEFNLLKEINNASKYDILLIDEPEASFDNPFISENIVDMIRKISQKTTVCITTHNSTLAMMLNPNKIIFTENKKGNHKVYYGNMGDKVFKSALGEEIISYDKVLEVLEAGKDVYKEKGNKYESFRNK